jgi:hypothetical protein
MSTCVRLFSLALLTVLAASEPLHAQTAAETARTWGLLGTWRLDCNKPASRADGELQYVVREGKLFHDREFGDARDSSTVTSLVAKADGSIDVVVNFTSIGQTREFSLIKGKDGRIRATSNRNVDTNEYSIRDGKFSFNGASTPWQTRCR